MKWGSPVLALGIIVLALFFIIPLIMENAVYDSSSDANSKVGSSSILGMNTGAHVNFVGTVKSTSVKMFGYCAMEVDGFNGYVICQNNNYANGEKVIVTGYVYGYSSGNVVLGSSGWSMIMSYVTPAEVSRAWWSGSFFMAILVLGIVIIVLGAVGIVLARKKQVVTAQPANYANPPQQYYPQQAQPRQQYYQPPPQPTAGQPYQTMQYPPGAQPQYAQSQQQPMGQPYPPNQYPPAQPGQYPSAQPAQYPQQVPPQMGQPYPWMQYQAPPGPPNQNMGQAPPPYSPQQQVENPLQQPPQYYQGK